MLRPSITPVLTVRGAHAAAEFYARAFGATEVHRNSYPDSKAVIEMAVGQARFRVADEAPGSASLSPPRTRELEPSVEEPVGFGVTNAGSAVLIERGMTTAAAAPTLAVGHPDRKRIGLAVIAGLWTTAAFVIYLWVAKEIPALYLREPWQDDPYDAIVSFAFFFVPILAALCVVRAALCRRDRPLPLTRARDLLVTGRLMAAIAGVTLLAEWVSVGLGVHRVLWNSSTYALFAVLAAMTMSVVGVVALTARALRRLPPSEAGPDWWTDTSAAVAEYWGAERPLGETAAPMLRAAIERLGQLVRARPLGVALVLSIGFGLTLAAFQALAEGGFAPAVYVLYVSVAGASMLAFLLAAGAHLRLAGPRSPRSSSRAGAAYAAGAAAAAFAAALAFRQPREPVAHLVPGRGVVHLLATCGLLAAGVGAAAYVAASALRFRRAAGR